MHGFSPACTITARRDNSLRMGSDSAGAIPRPPLKHSRALMRRLLHDYVAQQKLNLALAVACMAGGAAMYAVLAWLIDPTLRFLFLEKRPDMVLLVPAAIVATVLVRGLS